MTATPMNAQTRFNLSEIVRRLAGSGRDDPTIAACLGITAAQVRGIRAGYDIEAGEQRWTARTLPPETGDDR